MASILVIAVGESLLCRIDGAVKLPNKLRRIVKSRQNVHDSAFCYQEVAHFTGYSGELHARALAARLNALDLLDWPPRLELTA